MDEFEWADVVWGTVLRCRPLLAVADHFFTTRQLPLRGTKPEEDSGWRAAAAAIGVEPARLERMLQVHGTEAVEFPREPGAVAVSCPEPPADIAITRDCSCALAVKVADCVPVLLADPATGAVAAVHAGWRGTAAGAAGRAVAALASRYGSLPEELVAAVGPSIGPCCYEVGDDVLQAFEAAGHGARRIERWFAFDWESGRPHDGRSSVRGRLDLWSATRDQLVSAGLEERHVHVSRLCTASNPELFWSYRRDGPRAGRLAAVIRPRGPRTRP
ncbi:MAG: peptidoglycan editing factor PgeF [Vicinamibacterales bacterium]